jgi:hypothetical protein
MMTATSNPTEDSKARQHGRGVDAPATTELGIEHVAGPNRVFCRPRIIADGDASDGERPDWRARD